MSLQDYPGFFGYTSKGVIALHADWPIYPEEHGADLALLWLTMFPRSTSFKRIDDIDRCILLLADVKCSNRSDPFDARNFHVAIWHEDLLNLQHQGYVEGVSPLTEQRWEELERAKLPSGPLYVEIADGIYQECPFPPLEDYDGEDNSWPEFSEKGLAVTEVGHKWAAAMIADVCSDLASLGDRIWQLRQLGFFDTAVREACVALEYQIKSWLNSERWGDALVEEFISRLRVRGNLVEAHLRVLRGEIRTIFKFIRNDFMHNFVGIDEAQCAAVLFRLARVKQVLDDIAGID